MQDASNDFAANYARFLAVNNRLDALETQLAAILAALNTSQNVSGNLGQGLLIENATNISQPVNESLANETFYPEATNNVIALLDNIAKNGLKIGDNWRII